MSYDKASNAIVATVGFYADALAQLTARAEAAEQQRDQFARQNAELQREIRRAQRLFDAARIVTIGLNPPGPPENAHEVALLALMTAVKEFDERA